VRLDRPAPTNLDCCEVCLDWIVFDAHRGGS
jgi:hypothetical protein